VKVLCGLGNPGAQYAATRHNVGWWALEQARRSWAFADFARAGPARISAADFEGDRVLLIEPWTYMNRSGAALVPLLDVETFEPARDLLVIVDDAALDLGRIRLRARGSSGGHNGLKSVESTLRTREYARLRIGVGPAPDDVELADWVLAPFGPEEEARVIELLPIVVDAARTWIREGVDAAANRFNR